MHLLVFTYIEAQNISPDRERTQIVDEAPPCTFAADEKTRQKLGYVKLNIPNSTPCYK
jgi:hypothetical protein